MASSEDQNQEEVTISTARAERVATRDKCKMEAHLSQLLDQYYLDSIMLEKNIKKMSTLIQQQPLSHSGLKVLKKSLEDQRQEMIKLVEEIRGIVSHPDLENFSLLDNAVTSLLDQYRQHFPKLTPSAASSTITSSVMSEKSRQSVNEAVVLSLQKEAIAQEGEVVAQHIEEQIGELQKKMKEEQQQVEGAKQESRRKLEEANEARKKTEEAERQAEQIQKEVQAMIEVKRREKEAIIKKYKEKEWQVFTQFLNCSRSN